MNQPKIRCQEMVTKHRKEAWSSAIKDVEDSEQCTTLATHKIVGIDLYICKTHAKGINKKRLITL
jgi:hypothetical protein